MSDMDERDIQHIPIDDIEEAYAKAPVEVRGAITDLLGSGAHLCVTADSDGESVLCSWKSNPTTSIQFLVSVLLVGQREYGTQWLKELLRQLRRCA